MTSFWASHKHKILGALFGGVAVLGMMAANLFCGRLPAPFATLCVQGSQLASDALKEQAAKEKDTASTPAQLQDSTLEDCPDALCMSNGYSLPTPDGGKCRCIPLNQRK